MMRHAAGFAYTYRRSAVTTTMPSRDPSTTAASGPIPRSAAPLVACRASAMHLLWHVAETTKRCHERFGARVFLDEGRSSRRQGNVTSKSAHAQRDDRVLPAGEAAYQGKPFTECREHHVDEDQVGIMLYVGCQRFLRAGSQSTDGEAFGG